MSRVDAAEKLDSGREGQHRCSEGAAVHPPTTPTPLLWCTERPGAVSSGQTPYQPRWARSTPWRSLIRGVRHNTVARMKGHPRANRVSTSITPGP